MRTAPDPKQCEAAVQHFARVLVLVQKLAVLGAAVRGHKYDPHFFGSWSFVIGSFEHRFRFVWDARDQVLTVEEASFGEFGSMECDWKPVDEVIIDARKGADPFKYLEDFFSS